MNFETSVADLLRNLFHRPKLLILFFGYFPYKTHPDNSITFKLCSWPSLTTVIHICGGIFWIFWYPLFEENYQASVQKTYQFYASSTEKFTYYLMARTYIISTTIIRVFVLVKGQDIVELYNTVLSTASKTLIFCLKIDSELQGHALAEGTLLNLLTTEVHTFKKRVNKIIAIFCYNCLFFALFTSVTLYQGLLNFPTDFSVIAKIAYFVGSSYVGIFGIFLSSFLVWVAIQLYAVVLSFRILRIVHEQFILNLDPNEQIIKLQANYLTEYLETYVKIEKIIHKFNAVFTPCIFVNLTSSLVIFVLLSYSTINSSSKAFEVRIMMYVASGGALLQEICFLSLLCDMTDKITTEVHRPASFYFHKLKRISFSC